MVSGIDAASLAKVQGFYDQIVDTHRAGVARPKEAELTKLLENTFRHVNIALVNELAMFAADLGIDVWEAIDAASTKPFGYMRFTPGPGVGGHCLPVDPSYLSLAGEAPPRPELPVRRAGQRRERAHARLRGAPALQRPQRPGQGRSRAAASCCSACRSRPTSATGARARATAWPSCWPTSAPTCVAADPHVAPDRFPPGATPVECTAEELAAADAVVLLVDHAAFDPDVDPRPRPLRARHQGPPARAPPNVERL